MSHALPELGAHGPRLLAVDGGEAVLLRDLGGDERLPAALEHAGIRGERGYGAADELRRLRVREVEVVLARGEHRFRADERATAATPCSCSSTAM